MKRVQQEATREKVQHEKSARVKYANKKSAQEKCTRAQMDNGPSVDRPLYTGNV